MGRVRMTFLGGFAAYRPDGAAVTLPTRKAEALLAVLASRGGQPVRRESLTALLWGDRADRHARHNLSQTLTSIRRAFEDAPDPLAADRELVALRHGVVADVLSLDRLADSDDLVELEAAADLHRGPLLDGIVLREPPFEEWLIAERARLHALALSVHLRLAQRQAEAGDVEAGAATLVRAIALDPLSEEAHRRLMRLHVDHGSYNAAIRQYRSCADILRRQLATVPEPSTTALHEEAMRCLQSATRVDVRLARAEAPSDPAVAAPVVAAVVPPVAAAAGGIRPSIAVLPFVDLGGGEAQAVSDGFTEDVITELARFRELVVVARSPASPYRGDADDLARVGRELGVQFVVQGGVRRVGRRSRVTSRLIDVAEGAHVWADRFDIDGGDLLAAQDDVVQTIAARVAAHMELEERKRTWRRPGDSLAAYDCYLRGVGHVHGDTRETQAAARLWFERALALDGSYAAPMAMLAFIEVIEGFYATSDDHLRRAQRLAGDAVVLDPADSWPHCALGYIHLKRGSYDLAGHDFDQALRLNPNEPDHIAFRALHDVITGRPALALELMALAERLNPHVPDWYLAHRGYALHALRRYDEAARCFERQLSRPYWDACFLAACHARLGRMAEAHEAIASARGAMPGLSLGAFAARVPFAVPSDLDHVLDGLRAAGVPHTAS